MTTHIDYNTDSPGDYGAVFTLTNHNSTYRISPTVAAVVRKIVQSDKILAIKLIRDTSKAPLKEAKDFCDFCQDCINEPKRGYVASTAAYGVTRPELERVQAFNHWPYNRNDIDQNPDSEGPY